LQVRLYCKTTFEDERTKQLSCALQYNGWLLPAP
jgi:hypothetical protein